MQPFSIHNALLNYWSSTQLEINFMILLNISGALVLGMIVGYERAYHGRAAGMRTCGLVCMASCAVTIIIGYPQNWFGGLQPLNAATDPTRVIQGIVTGIGFLGAGVIMKEGMSISGLSTAASIWTSSVIGILCGAGFYFSAIMLSLIATAVMTWGGYIENKLPSRHCAAVFLHFRPDQVPEESQLKTLAASLGYYIAPGATTILRHAEREEWHLIFIANTGCPVSIPLLAKGLRDCSYIIGYELAFARN